MVNFRMLDLCGSIVGIMYNGKTRYKSTIGGILSIFLILGVFTIILVYVTGFFARSTTKMMFENMKYWNPPQLDITNNFHFVIMTQYNGTNEVRDDILKIEASYIYKNLTHWLRTPVSKIPCEESIMIPGGLYGKIELSKGQCFDTTNLILQGSTVNDVFSYLQIKVSICDMTKKTCFPPEQMQKYFEANKPVASIYFIDSAFQISNFTERVKKFYNYYDYNVTFEDVKEATLYFTYNEMNVDQNYFFPTTPTKYGEYMIDSSREMVSVRTEEQNDALIFNFLSSKKKEIIHISYMQLAELLTNICALANVTIMAVSCIGNYFNHFLFQSDLMNSIYQLGTAGGDNKCSESNILFPMRSNSKILLAKKLTDRGIKKPVASFYQKETSNIGIVNRSNHTPIVPTDQSNMVITNYQKCYNTKDQMMNNSFGHLEILKLSINPFCCHPCRKVREKKSTYHSINKALLLYQDMKNVYRKLQEVDLLKYLLLTEDQLSLYQIIPKPEFKKYDVTNKTSKEFANLVNNHCFHHLKSKGDIEKALRNTEVKSLLTNKLATESADPLYNKLLKLIAK